MRFLLTCIIPWSRLKMLCSIFTTSPDIFFLHAFEVDLEVILSYIANTVAEIVGGEDGPLPGYSRASSINPLLDDFKPLHLPTITH